MSTVISIEEVSKLYRLGEIGTGSLAHDVNRWWHKVRGKEDPYLKVGVSNDRTTKGDSDYVYAVKDVSFEVKQGEALGIIGRNGAGKSTLLKILSRVTMPTSGQIKVKGRIASLLEVGTGFHPELTGRENIFLNGAILGMRKAEIRAKFDEIVEFSGCERYIDTPVKRYSSGMYVRLAFAVAAHLEPEVLIVDEVLAVGDLEFQKKCLGKMKDVAGEGRTVLFVSHNMAAMRMLCKNSIMLSEGRVVYSGATEGCINLYYGNQSGAGASLLSRVNSIDTSVVVKSITINDETTDQINLRSETNTLAISIQFSISEPKCVELELLILDQYGNSLAFFSPGHEEGITPFRHAGDVKIEHLIKLPARMNHGKYVLKLTLTHHMVTTYCEIENVVLNVEGVPTKTGKVLEYGTDRGWLFLEKIKAEKNEPNTK